MWALFAVVFDVAFFAATSGAASAAAAAAPPSAAAAAAAATAAATATTTLCPSRPIEKESSCFCICKAAESQADLCEEVCLAVRGQPNASDCVHDLFSSFQHYALLAYSSGHMLETMAILVGGVAGDTDTSEDSLFLAQSHLRDRGSPAACSDVTDAHYCLGRGASTLMSFGVCLPESCDAAFIEGVLSDLTTTATSTAPSGTRSSSEFGGEGASPLSSSTIRYSFSCGDELRVKVDAGTVAVFYFVGALLCLVLVGTAVDYHHRRSSRQQSGGGGGVEESKGVGLMQRRPETEGGEEFLLPPMRSLMDFVIPEGEHLPSERKIGASYGGDDSGIGQPLLHPAAAAAAVESGWQQLPAEEGHYLSSGISNAGGASGGGSATLTPRQRRRRWCCERLVCFSLLVNTERLLASPRAGDEFRALDGVRTLSMLCVVLGNTIYLGAGFSDSVGVLPQNGDGLLSR